MTELVCMVEITKELQCDQSSSLSSWEEFNFHSKTRGFHIKESHFLMPFNVKSKCFSETHETLSRPLLPLKSIQSKSNYLPKRSRPVYLSLLSVQCL